MVLNVSRRQSKFANEVHSRQLLGIIQSILVQLAINNGLGRKLSTMKDYQLARFLKVGTSGSQSTEPMRRAQFPRSVANRLSSQYEYAAQILLIATIALSKLSLGLLFKNLMTSRRSLLASQILIGTIVAWAVASILALAFRCSMSAPWQWNQASQCIDQVRMLHMASSPPAASSADHGHCRPRYFKLSQH